MTDEPDRGVGADHPGLSPQEIDHVKRAAAQVQGLVDGVGADVAAATRSVLDGYHTNLSQMLAGPASAYLKDLSRTQSLLSDYTKNFADSATMFRGIDIVQPRLSNDAAVVLRSPDQATYEVASEVRDLAHIAGAMAENTKASAELTRSLLEQNALLLLAVEKLYQTTQGGVASSGRWSSTISWQTAGLLLMTVLILVLTVILVLRPNTG